jgi:hypothetical protein
MFDEDTTRAFVSRLQRQQPVAVAPAGTRTRIEDPSGHVDARKCRRLFPRQFTAQGEQAASVVGMIVRQDQISNGGEIDVELCGILQDGFRPRSGVDEQPASIHFEDGRKPPFANARGAVADQHG